MSPAVPLSVLDLIPISSGSNAGEAARNAIDLAQSAERFGYGRYWFAEHHLNPGIIGVAPAVAIALVAQATESIRLGSAGVQFGHRTPLSAVEEFGLISALHPGRLDLGIGRSPGRTKPKDPTVVETDAESRAALAEGIASYLTLNADAHREDQRTDNGLLLPKKFDYSTSFSPEKIAHLFSVLQQPGAWVPSYAEQIDEVLALLDGTFESSYGFEAHAHPAEEADLQLWILGANGGESATVAGEKGLRFVAGYHHSPATVIDAVSAYRAAFRPSEAVPEPYVAVSADVVVGESDEHAAELASGFRHWVRSIRTGAGAIPFPSAEEAAALPWGPDDDPIVADRVKTQIVGSPRTAVERLAQLRDATGAQELVITTITHDHADRVRSYELLADAWPGVGGARIGAAAGSRIGGSAARGVPARA
ncbi:LLM class flavin-dependent oxidoreductase [Patulibacter sp. NPDC049589]|uniref:LLM class flavin-dependent oxidoreductase n=1 Tax=Patulibacter sp. NPDC049589 TaxID=3154731 RepID=UPI0034347114